MTPKRWPPRAAWRLFFALAACVVVLDQASKAYAVLRLTDAAQTSQSEAPQTALQTFLWTQHPRPKGPQVIVPGFFHLRYVENPGAAWGFLSRSGSPWRTPLFLTISLLSMVLVPLYFRHARPEQKALRLALGLVLGGAVGNFLDRVRLSYVIDFIDWHLKERFVWPTFNVADAAITVGALLMVVDTLLEPKKTLAPQPKSSEES